MLRPSGNLNRLGVACCTLKQQLTQQQRLCWMYSTTASSRAYTCTAKSQNSSDNGEAATQELLSSRDLQQYISHQGIQACLVPQPVSTPPSQVVKSMVLVIKDHQAQPTNGSTATSSSSDADWTLAWSAATAAANLATPSADSSTGGSRETSDSENGHFSSTVNTLCPQSVVLVLLTGEVRVSEAAVAEHLGLPRRRLRLASREEAAAVTGYAVGAIPPFGHFTPLRTLIDVSISRQLPALETSDSTPQQPPHLMCAGGGDGDTQLLLSVQQLFSAIPAAETGTFAEYTAVQSAEDVQAVRALQTQLQQQRQHWAAQLPLPWPAGSSKVHLIGVVAQRRRIAKLLLFASLVPEDVPPLPPDGKAAYVRRLWRHPDMPGSRCEVQVIMGKTIERTLGRDATAALMDQVKVGSIISVKGHVQPHPAAAKAAQDTQPNGNSGSSSSVRNVLDVVAHEVSVLHKNRDTLAKALRKAQRQGKEGVKTAARLLQLQQQQWQVDEGQLASKTRIDSSRPHLNKTVTAQTLEWRSSGSALDLDMTASGGNPSNSSSSSFASATAPESAAATTSRLADTTNTAAVAAAPGSQEFWQLQLPLSAVHWVCDLAGILEMQQLVLQLPPGSNTTSSISSSSRFSSSSSGSNPSDSACNSSGSLADVVVGLDCEWKPYERGSTASPVALLQLATREHVFLIDMLAVCRQQQQQQPRDQDSSSSNGSRGVLQPSTAAEAALGQFLLQLLCSPDILKVGFQLTGDLDRLQQSYPQLACFQPTAVAAAGIAAASSTSGAAPLVNYVDLLQLSRVAVPSLVKVPHLSLSKLVQLALGKPLDKAQQTSHWDVRPLSLQQQVYAANDAHVLTCLFDELLRRAPEGSQGRVVGSIADGVRYLPVTTVADDAEVLA